MMHVSASSCILQHWFLTKNFVRAIDTGYHVSKSQCRCMYGSQHDQLQLPNMHFFYRRNDSCFGMPRVLEKLSTLGIICQIVN